MQCSPDLTWSACFPVSIGMSNRINPSEKLALDWLFCGRVDYATALGIQYAHALRIERLEARPCLFFFEHPPTITLGRQANPENLLLSPQQYNHMGIGLYHVLRGGDVTYHGPGQLVGYPVASLAQVGCSVPWWVQCFAQAIIDLLQGFGVVARWSEKTPGVWLGDKKIAAVGFHISHKISTHGFALNLRTNLSHYDTIVPCGLSRYGVTSMEEQGVLDLDMEAIAGMMVPTVARRIGLPTGVSLRKEYLSEGRFDCPSFR